jgi:hypothetical protein
VRRRLGVIKPRSPLFGTAINGGGRSAVVVSHVSKKNRLPGLVMYFLPLGEVQMTVSSEVRLRHRFG